MATGRIIFPNPFGNKLPSPEQVSKMQKKYGFSDAYADFLRTQNGFDPYDDIRWNHPENKKYHDRYIVPIDIDMTEEEIEEKTFSITKLYGLINEEEFTQLASRWEDLLPYFFPIGSDHELLEFHFVEVLVGEYQGCIGSLNHGVCKGVSIEDLFDDCDDDYDTMTKEERAAYLVDQESKWLLEIHAPSIREFTECCLCVVNDDVSFFVDYESTGLQLPEKHVTDDMEITFCAAIRHNTETALELQNARNEAGRLFNLSCNQGKAAMAETIETLRSISEERFKDDETIALHYVYGLYNLACDQREGAAETVEKLRQVSEKRFRDQVEIAWKYAQGLYNLAYYLNIADTVETIEKLRQLSEERFKNNGKIASEYAKGLANLSHKQDMADAVENVGKLRQLSEERFKDDATVALMYAKGLDNLLNKRDMDVEEIAEIVGKIRQMSEARFRNDAEIAHLYAKGLARLSNKQDVTGVVERIEELLCQGFSMNTHEKGVFVYAECLVSLSSRQDIAGAVKTIENLRKLSEEHFKEDAKMALKYAQGLFNLANKQDRESAAKILEKLRQMSEDFSEDVEIACVYAKALCDLSLKQDMNEASPVMFSLI